MVTSKRLSKTLLELEELEERDELEELDELLAEVIGATIVALCSVYSYCRRVIGVPSRPGRTLSYCWKPSTAPPRSRSSCCCSSRTRAPGPPCTGRPGTCRWG